MLQTFTVYTEKGEHGGLRWPVKIIFTITPVESKRSTWPFKPIKFDTLTFGTKDDRSNRKNLKWSTELGFRTYQVDLEPDGEGVWGYGDFHAVLPGQFCAITEFVFNPDGVHWSEPESYVDRVASLQSSVMAINKTGSPRNVFLACGVNGEWCPMAAYHEVEEEGYIIAPSELKLQAYVVDIDAFEDNDDIHVLLGALTDFRRPLFSKPLSCDALPTNSTWKLVQDKSGALKLINDSKPESAFYSTQDNVERLEKLVLDEVSGSLKELQAQMDAVQLSIEASGARLDKKVLAVEEKTARLTAVLERMEGRVAATEKSVGRAETAVGGERIDSAGVVSKLAALEKSGQDTRKDMSAVLKTLDNFHSQLENVKLKTSAAGDGTSELAKSFTQTQREIFTIRDSVALSGDQMSGLDRRIAAIEATAERIISVVGIDAENSGGISFPEVVDGPVKVRLSTRQ